ncbi:DUF167 domain-containing protein [Patescibacteria group bacterium]
MSEKIIIKVMPYAKQARVEKLLAGSYKVHVTAAPVDGQANKAVIELLAEYFAVKKRDVRILKGAKNRSKVVEILK